MTMTEVASVGVTFGADTSGFDRGIQHVESGISGLGQQLGSGLQRIGSSFTNLGAQITLLTAPLTAFGAVGIRTASNFEDAMAQISARTGLVGADLEQVRQFALKMGADTAFSAQQAADAFLQLLSSGQNAEQAMATLPVVLDAAAASGEDLGRSADMVTDIMAQFGLEVGDAKMVVDALARAAGASSADIASLGMGFGNVGPIANRFGMSVEDVAATLAVLSENGIKGAEAGTALKSMLLNMSRNTEEVVDMWGELGISLYDATGAARPLNEVLQDLQVSLSAWPVKYQNRAMQTLAGSYGIVALSALMGEQSIDDMKKSMESQADAAKVASARMDTFSGRLDSLKGSLETLMIRAFTPFMDEVLKPLAEQITKVVNIIAIWAAENTGLVKVIIGVVGAVAGLGAGLIAAGLALSAIGSLITMVTAAFGIMLGPITLIIAGLAALGVAYATNLGGFRDFVNGIVQSIMDAFPVVQGFLDFMGQALGINLSLDVGSDVKVENVEGAASSARTQTNGWLANNPVEVVTPAVVTFDGNRPGLSDEELQRFHGRVQAEVTDAVAAWEPITVVGAALFDMGQMDKEIAEVITVWENAGYKLETVETYARKAALEVGNFEQAMKNGAIGTTELASAIEKSDTPRQTFLTNIGLLGGGAVKLNEALGKWKWLLGDTSETELPAMNLGVVDITEDLRIFASVMGDINRLSGIFSTLLRSFPSNIDEWIGALNRVIVPTALSNLGTLMTGMLGDIKSIIEQLPGLEIAGNVIIPDGLTLYASVVSNLADAAARALGFLRQLGVIGGGGGGSSMWSNINQGLNPIAPPVGGGGYGGMLPPGQAMGGPVSGGTPYVVGELGPEIFVPNTSGRIIPNSRSDFGGGGVSVNVYGDVYDQRSLDNLVDRINRVVMMRAGA